MKRPHRCSSYVGRSCFVTAELSLRCRQYPRFLAHGEGCTIGVQIRRRQPRSSTNNWFFCNKPTITQPASLVIYKVRHMVYSDPETVSGDSLFQGPNKSLATYFAIAPNIYGKNHKVLSYRKPVREFICEANDGGTCQKHLNRILSPILLRFRINLYEESRKSLFRDE